MISNFKFLLLNDGFKNNLMIVEMDLAGNFRIPNLRIDKLFDILSIFGFRTLKFIFSLDHQVKHTLQNKPRFFYFFYLISYYF